MAGDLLVYGAYGYTGRLIAKRAVDAGLAPVLAGRRAEPLERLASDFGVDHRVFSLEYPRVIEDHVSDVDAVLHCAGPFSATAEPMVTACLETGTDYLDIAGSVEVLEWMAERDDAAVDHEIAVVPGVGFDVVATDCLAATLHDEVLDGTHLTFAIDELGTFSPGTIKSMIEGMRHPGVVREAGRLRDVPMAWKRREFTFEGRRKPAVTVPWGEVSTGYYTTGVPNIETYATVPAYAASAMERTQPLTPVLRANAVQSALKRVVDAAVHGPSPAERAESESHVYGEIRGEGGERATARLRTPDTYDLTATTAVAAAERVLDGSVDPGFQTPASAFGPSFVFEFDGVVREDRPERVSVEA